MDTSRHRHRAARILLLVCLPLATPASAEPASPPLPLLPNRPAERQLAAGDAHVYRASLTAGDRWLVSVEQHGIDVVVRALAAGGIELAVNAPTYRHGKESLLIPAGVAGPLDVEVRSRHQAVGPGRYRIRLDALSGADSRRLEAEAAVTEAARLYFQATPEARPRAIASYRQALELWRQLDDAGEQARALLSLAILHGQSGEPERAREHYRLVLPLLGTLGRHHAEAVALSNMGLAASALGHTDDAKAFLDRALALQRQIGNRYGEAVARNNLCLGAHRRGELRAARGCYTEVLAVLDGAQEQQLEAAVSSNLGAVYDQLGEPRQALDVYRRALATRRATGDRRGEARTLNNLGVLHRRLGQMREALDAYDAALEIFRQLADRRWQARTLGNIGSAYYSLGELERARAFLERSLSLRRDAGDRRGEAATLNNLGRVHASLGQTAAAAATHQRALDVAREIGDRHREATALGLLGRTRLAAGDADRALTAFDQALEILPAVGDRRKLADALHDGGEALLLLSSAGRALPRLGRALEIRRAIRDRAGVAQTLNATAEAEAELGRTEAALEHVRAALEIVESLRTRVLEPDLRAAFSGSQRRAYELHVELLMRRNTAEPGRGHARAALEASERNRARTLVEIMSEAGADPGRGAGGTLAETRRDLEQRVRAKALRQLQLLSRGQEEQEAELELYSALAELEKAEAEIRRQSPGDAAWTRSDPLTVAGVQALLDADTLLLEYALGDQRSYLWAVTPQSLESFELAGRRVIEDAARRAYRQLSVIDLGGGEIESDALAELSRRVLGPLAERQLPKRLLIVADGALHYIPFAALPLPARDRPPSGDSPAVLLHHQVVYLPSASTLAVQRRQLAGRPPAPGTVAVLADPVFEAHDPRVTRVATEERATGSPAVGLGQQRDDSSLDTSSFGLGRLPGSRREAESIAGLVPAGQRLVAVDFAANRELVFGGDLGRYRLVHFATHGVIDARRPELSGLALSLVDPDGNAVDGFLRLRDVYRLELDADLVVLSGCRTALGKEIHGEGLVGLTRGFMYAGARRVLASLWRVEDRATAELMTLFYRAMLKGGQSPAAALRQAQLAIREEKRWAEPYYWAGFVLQGEWQ